MIHLEGVYTALVTPFDGGQVDYAALRRIVDQQVAGGVAGIVPVGTTGESPTLTCEEHLKVIETVIEQAAGRCQIIAGTGANSTAEAVELTREAVARIAGRCEIESSGGITLDTLREYAECGVDFVSVGALTHQIKSLDMSLKAC